MVSSRSHDLIFLKGNLVIFIKTINYSFDPTILILRIYPTDTQSRVYNDRIICWSTIYRNRRLGKTFWKLNKLWHIYIMDTTIYATFKRN